MRTVIQ